jgi:hypothetical protein
VCLGVELNIKFGPIWPSQTYNLIFSRSGFGGYDRGGVDLNLPLKTRYCVFYHPLGRKQRARAP